MFRRLLRRPFAAAPLVAAAAAVRPDQRRWRGGAAVAEAEAEANPENALRRAPRDHQQRRGMDHGSLRIFSGNAHPELAEEVARQMGMPLSKATVSRFRNGEINVEINESIRDCDVFVIQPTCNGGSGPNENLMELLIMLDAIRRGAAYRVTAVMPVYGYARQNAQDKVRAPITARLVADCLQVAGANRVVTVELHAPQIQGFAAYPMDDLYALPLLVHEINDVLKERGIDPSKLVVVSPDVGGTKRAAAFARKLDSPLAVFSRQRRRATETREVDLVGEVDGMACIIVDDIADSCGTLVRAAEKLKARGASAVVAAVVHGVLSGPACEELMKSEIDTLIVTDTIPLREKAESCSKLRVVTVAPLLASAIDRLHFGGPLSTLREQLPDGVTSKKVATAPAATAAAAAQSS